jgi:cytidylate kinase
MTDRVIAIDGPAGSGKSTVARAVARKLGMEYLDTGAMYRAVTFAVLRRGLDASDVEKVAGVARDIDLTVGDTVVVDGEDATAPIRGPEVSAAVSVIAAQPAVRAELVRRQREWVAARGGGVVEGRDIGTVVFPGAELKVYLTASEEERIRRRKVESGDEAVAAEVARRDRIDSSRAASPLVAADDSVVIDTTDRSIDEIVEEVLSKL